jgi:hypothetical protein
MAAVRSGKNGLTMALNNGGVKACDTFAAKNF